MGASFFSVEINGVAGSKEVAERFRLIALKILKGTADLDDKLYISQMAASPSGFNFTPILIPRFPRNVMILEAIGVGPEKIPGKYKCPITGTIMDQPVYMKGEAGSPRCESISRRFVCGSGPAYLEYDDVLEKEITAFVQQQLQLHAAASHATAAQSAAAQSAAAAPSQVTATPAAALAAQMQSSLNLSPPPAAGSNAAAKSDAPPQPVLASATQPPADSLVLKK
jgi:hypothetical protein